MRFPTRAIIESLRKMYPVGTRVELEKMNDPQAPPSGTVGEVMFVSLKSTSVFLVAADVLLLSLSIAPLISS